MNPPTLLRPGRKDARSIPKKIMQRTAVAILALVVIATSVAAQTIGPTCWCQIDISFLVDGKFTHGMGGFTSPNPGLPAPCNGGPLTITTDGQTVGWPGCIPYGSFPGSTCPYNVAGSGISLANGDHTVVIQCSGGQVTCDPPGSGQNCTTESQSVTIPITVADNGISMTIDSAPVNGSTIPVQAVTFSGTITSLVPGASAYFANAAASFLTGNITTTTANNWTVTLDTTSLLAAASTSGVVSLGFYAIDPLSNIVTFSTGYQQFENAYTTLDPKLVRNFVVDSKAPNVTFDLGDSTTVTTLTAISGTVTDNIQLGSLTLYIQDLTDPASSYWSDSLVIGFQSGAAHPISIPINSGKGAVSSAWSYAGISDTFMASGHSYLVTAIAADSVNNISTTTLTVSIPQAAQLTEASAMLPESNETLQFDPPGSFVIQYSSTNLSPSYCGHLSNESGAPHSYRVDSVDNVVKPSLDPTPPAGCDVAVKIVANIEACLPSAVVRVFDNEQLIGTLPGTILIPTSESGALIDKGTPIVRSSFSQNRFAQLWTYGITLSGNSPSMNLAGEGGSEKIFARPLVGALAGYPRCTANPNVLRNQGITGSGPSFTVLSGNKFPDAIGFDPQINNFIDLPGGLFSEFFNSVKILCGNDLRQHYFIHACEVPQEPTAIDIQLNVISVGSTNPPASLFLMRSEVNENLNP